MAVLILSIILIPNTINACGLYCLKCDMDTEKCLACDRFNNYVLKDDKCEKEELTGCKQNNRLVGCLTCDDKHYLKDNKCVKLTEEETIQNCDIYKQDKSCLKCKSKYYIDGSKKCAGPVEKEIKDCVDYQDATNCNMCGANMDLADDKKSCIEFPNDLPDCLNFSRFKCVKCKDSNILNLNMNTESEFMTTGDNLLENLYNYMMEYKKNQSYRSVEYDVCQTKNQIEKCAEYETYDTCKTCDSGTFLGENKMECETNPEIPIKDCVVYDSSTTCATCADGKRMETNNKSCIAASGDAECNKYNSSVNDDKCLECKNYDTHYLKDQKTCTKRSDNPAYIYGNCEEKDQNKDECKTCKSDHVQTSNVKQCITKDSISDCMEYSFDSQSVSCTKCKDNFYLKENKCTEHTLTAVDKCSTYSDNSKKCKECDSGFYTFSVGDRCIEYTTGIGNCKLYENTSTKDSPKCKECEVGYKLNGNKCELTNCSDDNCSSCLNDKNLFEDNSGDKLCDNVYSHVTNSCANIDYNNGGSPDNVTCETCNEDYFAFDQHNVCIEDKYLAYTTLGKKNISGCEIYQQLPLSGKSMLCAKCAAGKFLNSVKTQCVDTCDKDILLIDYGSNSTESFNLCLDSETKILRKYSDEITQSYKHLECTADNYPLIKAGNKTFNNIALNYYLNDGNSFTVMHPLSKSLTVECEKVLDNEFLDVSVKTNCDVYAKMNDKVGCLRCKNGYEGSITGTDNRLMHKCEAADSNVFNQAKIINNLNSYESNLFSNTFCKNASDKPVLFGVFTNGVFDKYVNYTISSNTSYAPIDGSVVSKPVKCIDFSSADNLKNDLSVSSVVGTYEVENCALYTFNIDGLEPNNYTITKVNEDQTNRLSCVKCITGYSESRKTSSTNQVITCTKINNANTSNVEVFGGVDMCADNYSFKMTNKVIDYEKCEQSDISKCMVYEDDNGNKQCKLCHKGYNLFDNQCVKFTSFECDSEYNHPMTVTSLGDKKNAPAVTYHNESGYGCNKCKNGYSSVVDPNSSHFDTKTCVELKEYNEKIPNCNKYKKDNSCAFCDNDFTVKIDGTECFSSTANNDALKDCDKAESASKCTQCASGKAMKQDKCTDGDIDQCKTHKFTSNSEDKFYCDACNDLYIVNDDKTQCIQPIENCKIYSDKSTCNTCIDNYFVLTKSSYKTDVNSTDICIKINAASSQCEFGRYENGGFFCQSCKSKFFNTEIDTATDYNNRCHMFPEVKNCDEYNLVVDNLANTDFTCKTCKTKFYLENKVCKAHTIIADCKVFKSDEDKCQECNDTHYLDGDKCAPRKTDSNCESYVIDENKCSKCVSTHFLNGDGNCEILKIVTGCKTYKTKENKCDKCSTDGHIVDGSKCVENTQVKECKEYNQSNNKECTKCNTGFYLDNNKCRNNPTGISDCITYSNRTTCQKCGDDHYLENNECKEADPKILNCKEYTNKTTCEKCKNTFVLVGNVCKSTDITNCADFTDEKTCKTCKSTYKLAKSVDKTVCEQNDNENCTTYEDNTDGNCLLCKDGYYLSDKKCKDSNDSISDCVMYESDTLCKKCKSTHILSKDRKSCIKNEQMFDSDCMQIEELDGYSCSRCYPDSKLNDSSVCVKRKGHEFDKGCFLKDLQTNSKCLMCREDYYMNKSGKCTLSETKIVDNNDNDKNVTIISIISILLTLLSLF